MIELGGQLGETFSWRVKYTRASVHLERLKAEVETYLTDSQASFVHEYDVERHQLASVLRAEFPPPLSIGATVGDVLHNLRSALDNITWHLVKMHNPMPSQPRQVQFPITYSSRGFEKEVAARLPGLPREATDALRRLQPWYWPEEARRVLGDDAAGHEDVEASPLAQLHRLSNEDKHRAIHALTVYAGLNWIGAPEEGAVTILRGDPPPWAPGDVVVRWQLADGVPVESYSPNGEVTICLDPDDADVERSVVDRMATLHSDVRFALGQIEREVLKLYPLEREQEVRRLQQAFHAAKDAERELARRHMSRSPEVSPQPYTAESLAERARLHKETVKARKAWDHTAREVYGIW
jgi:hypothetical protein